MHFRPFLTRRAAPAILALVFALSLLSSGCRTAPGDAGVTAPAPAAAPLPSGKGWWYARFRIAWPEGEEPDWSMGALIADRVVAPVLKTERGSIELWRFHRRAVRDQAGHAFSFIFYATPESAQRIYQAIECSPQLDALRADQSVVWVGFDDTSSVARPAVKDVSDPAWPEIIQQSWPQYIMGASQMWLELVQALAATEDKVHKDERAHYHAVQDQLDQLWADEGRHVFLHHLNALFGYQPIQISEKTLMRF